MSALSVKAGEESTYIVTAVFSDADGTTVVPVSASWSLRDSNHNIVNSRQDVSITPATTITVVLSGDDLVYTPITKGTRVFTIKAVYNSSTYGNGLTLNDECTFEIDPLIGVTDS